MTKAFLEMAAAGFTATAGMVRRWPPLDCEAALTRKQQLSISSKKQLIQSLIAAKDSHNASAVAD
eukprot:COSAG01_NODE_32335_length_583_cov_0.712810_2_plen_64_part_01